MVRIMIDASSYRTLPPDTGNYVPIPMVQWEQCRSHAVSNREREMAMNPMARQKQIYIVRSVHLRDQQDVTDARGRDPGLGPPQQ